jgi:hypothetical protein
MQTCRYGEANGNFATFHSERANNKFRPATRANWLERGPGLMSPEVSDGYFTHSSV